MPILQPNPWRRQFFDFQCPDDVVIPVKDHDAYRLNPDHSWTYNKLLVAEKAGLRCGPHGLTPDAFPVFSKPIYNLRSMGVGSGVLNTLSDYESQYNAGYMWCELLEGQHLSTDVAVIDGKAVWSAQTVGHPSRGGTFDYWEVQDVPDRAVESYISAFISGNFKTYSGMMNFETIGGKVIEIHLRFADQWPDLYGKGFVLEVVNLYSAKGWRLENPHRKGYSVVLFDEHRQYAKPPVEAFDFLIDGNDVTSIQLCFDETVPHQNNPMPPGGFRTAIVNGFDLEKCKLARSYIKSLFDEANNLGGVMPLAM